MIDNIKYLLICTLSFLIGIFSVFQLKWKVFGIIMLIVVCVLSFGVALGKENNLEVK